MDLTPVVRFALLLVRPGMVVMLAPGLGGRQMPAMVKIGLTVLLAVGRRDLTALASGLMPSGCCQAARKPMNCSTMISGPGVVSASASPSTACACVSQPYDVVATCVTYASTA